MKKNPNSPKLKTNKEFGRLPRWTSGHKPKVVVAMSGGVDSSVAAALLKKSGCQLVGVFMKFWTMPGAETYNRCCSLESEKRARRVAQILNIPFYVLDLKKEFKKRVVDYFLREYRVGRTPNPCVVCNKEIKFGILLKKTLAIKADYIATGHYARIQKVKSQKSKIKNTNQNSKINFKIQTSNFKLLKGKDKTKDQSYFLWQLSQKQLKHIIFPVGEYTKKQVREMAKKFNLPTAKTPESQEICFVQTTLNEFLRKQLKTNPGKITDLAGKILGQHQGLHFYTIGQRKNIDVPQGPWYVAQKDIKNNVLVVSRTENDILKKEMFLKKTNWLSGRKPKFPLGASIKIRYYHPAMPATIVSQNKIIFKKAQRAITPGQSAVFYKKNEVLGGGIIKN